MKEEEGREREREREKKREKNRIGRTSFDKWRRWSVVDIFPQHPSQQKRRRGRRCPRPTAATGTSSSSFFRLLLQWPVGGRRSVFQKEEEQLRRHWRGSNEADTFNLSLARPITHWLGHFGGLSSFNWPPKGSRRQRKIFKKKRRKKEKYKLGYPVDRVPENQRGIKRADPKKKRKKKGKTFR